MATEAAGPEPARGKAPTPPTSRLIEEPQSAEPPAPREQLGPRRIMRLQRVIGNHQTTRLLNASGGSWLIQRGPLSGPKKTSLTTEFELAGAFSLGGCRFGDETADLLIAKKASLKDYVDKQDANLRALISFAEAGAASATIAGQNLDVLIRFNTFANKRLVGFRSPTPQRLTQILDWADAAPGPELARLKSYAHDVSLETLDGVAKNQAALHAVGTILNSGGNITAGNITGATIVGLQAAYAAFPPNSGTLPAFTGWGPAEAGSVDANKLDHIRKHVLRLGNAGNPDTLEPLRWKRALGLGITRQLVGTWAGGEDAVRAYFKDDGSDFLSEGQADAFYNTFLPTSDATVAGLIAQFGDQYYNAVVGAAAALQRAVIASNGVLVKVLGYGSLSGENVFIAGRVATGGGTPTAAISSGYITRPGEDQLTTSNVGTVAWWVKT